MRMRIKMDRVYENMKVKAIHTCDVVAPANSCVYMCEDKGGTKMVVKVMYIHPTLDTLGDYNVIPIDFFEEEVMFSKEMSPLTSFIPRFITSEIITTLKDGIIFQKMKHKMHTSHLTYMKKNGIHLGLIVYEYLDGYMDLYSLAADKATHKKGATYYHLARALFLQLAMDTGYWHGDPHIRNVMINPKDPYTNPKVVDLGLVYKLSDDELFIFKHFYEQKEYTKAMKYLSSLWRATCVKYEHYRIYAWFNMATKAEYDIMKEMADKNKSEMIPYYEADHELINTEIEKCLTIINENDYVFSE
jgi:hypothetical protein